MPSTIENTNITLIGVDGVGTDYSILKALKYSKQFFPNAAVKFLTSGHHNKIDNSIEHIQINPLNYNDFSFFCLTELHKFIDTEYLLYCHGDGFVVNPHKWNKEFMNYDYIGAPWPKTTLYHNAHRFPIVKKAIEDCNHAYQVGNGGFSIRTKKLMSAVASLYTEDLYTIPEDLVIGIVMRKKLQEMNFKFVDDIVFASSFSCETRVVDGYIFSSDNSFGFHCGGTHPDKVKLLESL